MYCALIEKSKVGITLSQGTVLAHIMFNIYTNDLLQIKISSNFTRFVHDTVMY